MKALPVILIGLAAVASAYGPHGPDKASIGAVTPKWSVTDSTGQPRSIEDYRGKYVVLEWTNAHCPYVHKHYDSGNMQATQEKAKEMGAVWFTVNTSAPGNQGYLTPDQVNSYRKEMKVKSTATVLDTQGTLGRIYSAKATPQIVVIDPKGVVIYNGAIDNRATPDPADIPGATNYALAALKESMAGKPVSVPSSRPYGCGVKY
jgi:peroxiredoxin